ncbi:MAG TPA: hypothetical protein VG097_07800, partial [Gemmata sp.]|nr:hypothetical protein [Gemmata sp.]
IAPDGESVTRSPCRCGQLDFFCRTDLRLGKSISFYVRKAANTENRGKLSQIGTSLICRAPSSLEPAEAFTAGRRLVSILSGCPGDRDNPGIPGVDKQYAKNATFISYEVGQIFCVIQQSMS